MYYEKNRNPSKCWTESMILKNSVQHLFVRKAKPYNASCNACIHLSRHCSVWNTREPSQMADLLDSWLSPSHLVSDWLRSAVMDQLIMPRLTTAVDNWDPLTDTVPIHMWIHPWLHIASKYYRCHL